MDLQLVPNISICKKSYGNHHCAAGGDDDGDDNQLHDDDDDYHNYQANNLCDLGIERDTLLELCKNFKQIPQVVFLLIADFGKTPNWRLASLTCKAFSRVHLILIHDKSWSSLASLCL